MGNEISTGEKYKYYRDGTLIETFHLESKREKDGEAVCGRM